MKKTSVNRAAWKRNYRMLCDHCGVWVIYIEVGDIKKCPKCGAELKGEIK